MQKFKFKIIVINFAIFVTALLASLLLAEASWYVLVPPSSAVTQIFNSSISRSNPPSISWDISTNEYTTTIRTNSDGFRGPEIIRVKNPDKTRILFIGDSFVEAKQVSEEERFTNLVGENFGEDVEVVSMGLDGSSPYEEYLFFQEIGKNLHPDVVVLCTFALNDMLVPNDELYTFEGSGINKRLKSIQVAEPILKKKPWYRKFRFTVALVTFINRTYDRFTVSENDENYVQDINNMIGSFRGYTNFGLLDYEEKRAWETTMPFLKSYQELVESTNAEFYVLLIPSAAEIHEDWREELKNRFSLSVESGQWNFDGLNDRIESELIKWNISYLDLQDEFKSKGKEERLFFKRDPHFNLLGHKVAADYLFSKLSNTILIK